MSIYNETAKYANEEDILLTIEDIYSSHDVEILGADESRVQVRSFPAWNGVEGADESFVTPPP